MDVSIAVYTKAKAVINDRTQVVAFMRAEPKQGCHRHTRVLFPFCMYVCLLCFFKIDVYTPWSIKKRATFIFMITLTNIDRFP